MSVLWPGDQVQFHGAVHHVVGYAGTCVLLESPDQAPLTLLLTHLSGAADFAVLNRATPRSSDAGRSRPLVCHQLDDVTSHHADLARQWECHVIEVETGLPPNPTPGTAPRAQYDVTITSQRQRDIAKAAELTAAGIPTTERNVRRQRQRYREGGVRALVDGRAFKTVTLTGRVDPRLVAALQAAVDRETHQSTGTRSRLLRRALDDLHTTYGADTVPLPSRASMYRLLAKISTGRHTFGAATTRRSLANRPPTPFGTTWAVRPGQQVQIDTTTLDILARHPDGQARRVELTIAIDVATRTICAAILCPGGTKAVDVSLLLARMLVPEPMRPGWSQSLRLATSRLPFERLVDVDERMRLAAAKPVIVAESITCDRGRIYTSQNFLNSCQALGISVQPAHPYTPTDKGVVERTFGSINTLFCQYVAGYTGRDPSRRGRDIDKQALWSIAQLQDLLDEWIITGWQTRPHQGLVHPDTGQSLSPNEMYAHLVAVAGYLPLPLTGDDYVELLPHAWRAIRQDGVRLFNRTYDGQFGDGRGEHSGVGARRGLWEVHYDPYDLSQVWVRNHRGDGEWIQAAWTGAPLQSAPFADLTWRATHHPEDTPTPDQPEQQAPLVLDELLRRAETGPSSPRPDTVIATTPPDAPAARRRPTLRVWRRNRPDPATARTNTRGTFRHRDDAETDVDITLAQSTSVDVLDIDAEARRWR